jgi:sugar lactone lactonase YvrE
MCTPLSQPESPALLFVSGLNQPRGMAFDAEGNLYVAEAGARIVATSGEEPADLNHSGRLLRIDANGHITTVAEGLPYTYSPASGDAGVTDVAILDDSLYLLTGEGYDDQLSRTLFRLTAAQTLQPVAGFLNFAIGMASSTEQVIGSVTSNPYSLAVAPDGSAFYIADGATGRILRVTDNGQIRVFAELPGMPPLAGMTFGPDGNLYVAMFSLLPHLPGSGELWAADPSGKLTLVLKDLTMPIDVAFDAAGALYLLEFGAGPQADRPYIPGGGRLLRIAEDGTRAILLDHLDYPTSLAFSPAGDLYIATGEPSARRARAQF